MTDQCPPENPATEQHLMLAESVGLWDVECTYFHAPGEDPMVIQATEEVKQLGPYWVVTDFRADMGGMPFQGMATMGYLTHKSKWIGTWIDTLAPVHYYFEGDLKDGILEMSGKCFHPLVQAECMYRSTEERISAGKRKFEMFTEMAPGTEVKMCSYIYTRKA